MTHNGDYTIIYILIFTSFLNVSDSAQTAQNPTKHSQCICKCDHFGSDKEDVL